MYYRVNGRTVEVLHNEKWVVAYYCTTAERAVQCLVDCEKRAAEWAKKTKERRMRAILRTESEAKSERLH